MTYEQLVNKRKNYDVDLPGLINQSQLNFDDGCYLDPRAKWHNSIPANIVVIGQDWGNVKYYEANRGLDLNTNPTCSNLIKLFGEIGMDIGSPTDSNNNLRLHFANIIPFLRKDKMQGSLELILNQEIIDSYASEFVRPLINIVNPKIIITLGLSSYRGVLSIFGKFVPKYQTLISQLELSPFELPNGSLLFAMFHCGASVINRNRNLSQQQKDWSKLKFYIDK